MEESDRGGVAGAASSLVGSVAAGAEDEEMVEVVEVEVVGVEEVSWVETTDNTGDELYTGIRVVAAAGFDGKNSPPWIVVVRFVSDEVGVSAWGADSTTTAALLLAMVAEEVMEVVTGIDEGRGGGGLGEKVESSQAVIHPSYA